MLAAIASCSLFYGAAAFAADAPYVGAMFGTTLPNDSTFTDPAGNSVKVDYYPDWNLAFMAGYKFGMARIEGEIGYQKHDVDTFAGGTFNSGGDLDIWRFMVNGYWDFDTHSPWIPYLVAGIGLANVEVNDLTINNYRVGDEDDGVFAYQLGGGVGYAIDNATTLFLDYRYFATADPDFAGAEAEFGSHNLSVGMRLSF
jgi:opacity protein-like surface antigen